MNPDEIIDEPDDMRKVTVTFQQPMPRTLSPTLVLPEESRCYTRSFTVEIPANISDIDEAKAEALELALDALRDASSIKYEFD